MLQSERRRCEGTAMGVIVLDLRPGLGLGPFSLDRNASTTMWFIHSPVEPVDDEYNSFQKFGGENGSAVAKNEQHDVIH